VFGATAEATFVMAHDDLITIDQLQAYLRGPGLRGRPIELLTLSACETAEGDDRAPLGLSGAALKAQAESALGSLWPVSDDAAQQLMAIFYGKLVRNGSSAKAKALQQAQVRMIGQDAMKHPYFWAPFILVERRL
jgi:CHAT domain-containing protein